MGIESKMGPKCAWGHRLSSSESCEFMLSHIHLWCGSKMDELGWTWAQIEPLLYPVSYNEFLRNYQQTST